MRALQRRGVRRRLAAPAAVLALASVVLIAPPASADQVRELEYWLDDYGIREAWTTTQGEGVTIAVIDSGIDSNHPDLAGAVVGGKDFSGLGAANGQTPVGNPRTNGHATMVASLAAGRGTNGTDGVIGVAPAASLLSLSMGFGEGSRPSDDQIAEAVRWAVDNGADVINMSLTRNTLDWPTSWDDAFSYAMANDVVVVAAAGNRGSGTVEVGAPATMPGVLTVAGVDRSGTASFDASSQGITIGVSAPSEDLVGAAPGGGHVTWQGTSGATPIVAGLVALVRSAFPALDAANVINRIVATAEDAGTPGPDPLYGNGLIDAAAAVRDIVPQVDKNPMGDLSEWIRLHRRADAPVQVPPVDEPAPEPAPTPEAKQEDRAVGLLGMLPGVNSLRLVGVPLAVLTGFGALFITLVAVAVLQFRKLRRR
ncbi:S8 family serine peptidase [Diaminobutyricimonas sp. LJ205]|uniref:S8 family serine peptidase n=1 Tax=Diaminobutyricimonas sp. LJ205 TaxID=2683590 RepID=UPI001E5FD665|nr:S8 family serine peptidase [Diaminobutyricimonas sp. LJ205]